MIQIEPHTQMSTPSLAPPADPRDAELAAAAPIGRTPKNLGRLGGVTKYLRIKMLANLSPAELSSVACVSRAFHPTDGSKGLVEAACAELVKRLRAKYAATPGVVPAWAKREGESWAQWLGELQRAALVRARRAGDRPHYGSRWAAADPEAYSRPLPGGAAA